MEQTIYDRYMVLKENRIYKALTEVMFPLLIVLMAFIKVNRGLDITDSAYSPGNFQNVSELDGMWYFSTFYANLTGSLFIHLPFGNTFLGMNIYTGVVKLLIALLAYFFFIKTVKAEKEIAFIGALTSVALCWCPTTILYNYLTYLFFFLGAVFLYKGLCEEKNGYLLWAGFFLGSNLFVRLPNVAETALILAVWFYSLISKDSFRDCLLKTGRCILGYIIGIIPGVVLIAVTRGFSEYFSGISELFAMTEDAPGYSAVSMIKETAKAYAGTWKWDEIAIFMALAVLLVFLVLPSKLSWLRYLAGTAVIMAFVFLEYKNGLFDPNIHYHGATYRSVALLLSIILVWMIGVLIFRKHSKTDKLLACISIIVICITPLGSNNQIYSNINNMFFVLPAFFFLLIRFAQGNEHFNGVRYAALVLSLVICLYGCIVGATAVFRDGLDGKMNASVSSCESLKGMKTTETNASLLNEAGIFWNRNVSTDAQVVLYGNVSGLGFYFDAKPAISTAWPSLDSFSAAKFREDMQELEESISTGACGYPAVVIGIEEYEGVFSMNPSEKQAVLKDFLVTNEYVEKYVNDKFGIFLSAK